MLTIWLGILNGLFTMVNKALSIWQTQHEYQAGRDASVKEAHERTLERLKVSNEVDSRATPERLADIAKRL